MQRLAKPSTLATGSEGSNPSPPAKTIERRITMSALTLKRKWVITTEDRKSFVLIADTRGQAKRLFYQMQLSNSFPVSIVELLDNWVGERNW